MTRRWGKLDVKLHENDKFRPLSLSERGLWVTCLTWAADNETDGFVPRDVAIRFVGQAGRGAKLTRFAPGLVAAGLWVEVDGGYMIHDFADYQMTKIQKVEVRAADATRQRRRRASSGTARGQLGDSSGTARGQLGDSSDALFPDESVVSHRDIVPKSKRERKTPRETSSLVARVGTELALPRQDASTLIAEWIDLCGTPPARTKGQMSRELRVLLEEYPYDVVRAAMLEWIKVGGYGPSALSGFVYTVMNPKNPVAKLSTTDTRVLNTLGPVAAKMRELDEQDAAMRGITAS